MNLEVEMSSNIQVHGSLYILGVRLFEEKKKSPFWRFILIEHLNLDSIQHVRWALESNRLIQNTQYF